jgi:manganese transport protein
VALVGDPPAAAPGAAHGGTPGDASAGVATGVRDRMAGDRPGTAADPVAGAAGSSGLALLRSRGRVLGVVALLGPAFVAAIAYVDPGNFATNVAAGAGFGYTLAWVVVVANMMAMLVQYLSAKTGVATGRDLPELCREHYRPAVARGLWVQAELVAMATDLGEFVGAAIGLNLLFRVPPLLAGLATAPLAFAILALEQRGYRPFERAIAALLGIVFLGIGYDLVVAAPQPQAMAAGLMPGLSGSALLLATGIVGATVMPHAVYLHSALTKSRVSCRDAAERRALLRFQRIDVLAALGAASLVNLAMLFVAAAVFHRAGPGSANSIEAAHAGLGRLVGGGAALAFAVALLASGLSSSSVGTYAGQVVMAGFVRRRIPLYARRALTMLPALLVLGLGLPATSSLVLSQVVLAFGIPFALVPLIALTSRRDVMGPLVNRPVTTALASATTAVIILLNASLLALTVLRLIRPWPTAGWRHHGPGPGCTAGSPAMNRRTMAGLRSTCTDARGASAAIACLTLGRLRRRYPHIQRQYSAFSRPRRIVRHAQRRKPNASTMTVSAARSRSASPTSSGPRSPSRIQASRRTSSRWLDAQRAGSCATGPSCPACQNSASSSTTGKSVTWPSCRARTDLPAPPRPTITTRFTNPSCRVWPVRDRRHCNHYCGR